MVVIGSIIARLGSKRLSYKNILPFNKEPLVGIGIKKLRLASSVGRIIVSTESELIARIAYDYGAEVLQRPPHLASDDVPSIPVFQHILEHFPADLHVNYNINFPLCHPDVINRAVEIALRHHESLSVPFAVWAQTADRLKNYPDPWKITAHKFNDDRASTIDVHTENDLLNSYREAQGPLPNWKEYNTSPKKN